jgi:hypothetical protein
MTNVGTQVYPPVDLSLIYDLSVINDLEALSQEMRIYKELKLFQYNLNIEKQSSNLDRDRAPLLRSQSRIEWVSCRSGVIL